MVGLSGIIVRLVVGSIRFTIYGTVAGWQLVGDDCVADGLPWLLGSPWRTWRDGRGGGRGDWKGRRVKGWERQGEVEWRTPGLRAEGVIGCARDWEIGVGSCEVLLVFGSEE